MMNRVPNPTSLRILGQIEHLILGILATLNTRILPDIAFPNWGKEGASFSHVRMRRSSPRRFACCIFLLSLIVKLIVSNKHATKRDIYYTNTKLFGSQRTVDELVDSFANLFQCRRRDLHVVASSRGIAGGTLVVRQRNAEPFAEARGIVLDTRTNFQTTGIPLPAIPFPPACVSTTPDTRFILVVEGESTFTRLLEDEFCRKYPCILVTGKGYPDVATRLFLGTSLRDLRRTMPVYILTDADPHGLDIVQLYRVGSKRLRHQADEMKCDVQRIGVSLNDIEEHGLPRTCLIDLTPTEVKRGLRMYNQWTHDEIRPETRDLRDELALMLQERKKAEIQALCAVSVRYLADTYLPSKIRECQLT